MISGLNRRLIGRDALQGKRFAASAQSYQLSAWVGELLHVVRRNAAHRRVLRLVARTFCFIAAPADLIQQLSGTICWKAEERSNKLISSRSGFDHHGGNAASMQIDDLKSAVGRATAIRGS